MCKMNMTNHEAPVLEVKGASYIYDGETVPVWSGLSCQFYKGKIHAIAGPSGSGKSSVLYMLDGMIPHTIEGSFQGTMFHHGEDITAVPPRYRCGYIGMVMQNPESQFCTFTVEEELAFGMENLSILPEQMRERIRKVLAYVGMEGYEERDLNQLSGGQKQKIAIAAILVMEPEILLLDEPTANLDPKSRAEVFELIIRLAREEQKTIILVEHNLEEIAAEVDYLYDMSADGKLTLYQETDMIRRVLAGRNQMVRLESGAEAGGDVSVTEKPVILELTNVAFAYEKTGGNSGKQILNGVNLQVRERDFMAILGENGAGKSTLMHIIFQIFKQNCGRISLYGKPVEKYRKHDLYRQMGLVFQNPENQFITNTVMDEMMFSLKKEKISQEEKEARVMEMLRRFHLENDTEKSPFVLSQGQKRRLSVATMLLTGQKILFLDEPTYGQDFENRQELMNDMWKLNESGVTIIMITHDLSLVKTFADRVAVLEHGCISRSMSVKEYFAESGRKEGASCLHI